MFFQWSTAMARTFFAWQLLCMSTNFSRYMLIIVNVHRHQHRFALTDNSPLKCYWSLRAMTNFIMTSQSPFIIIFLLNMIFMSIVYFKVHIIISFHFILFNASHCEISNSFSDIKQRMKIANKSVIGRSVIGLMCIVE